MVIPSAPAAPPLAFTRSHACRTFLGQRMRSNRSVEEAPCSSCSSRCTGTRPVGFIVLGKAAAVEPLPTSSALPEWWVLPACSPSRYSLYYGLGYLLFPYFQHCWPPRPPLPTGS